MGSARSAVAVAVLLALAGCSGVAPGPSPEPIPATTQSPTYPPGVTAEGLQDPSELVGAHIQSVRKRGAGVTSNSTASVLIDGETRTVDFNASAWATPDGARVYYASHNARIGANGTLRLERFELYANETAAVTRHALDGDVTTSTSPRAERGDLVSLHVARSGFLNRVLTRSAFDVAGVERRGDRTVTTLTADETTFTDSGRRVFAATLEVAASGRILSLSVTQNPNANTEAGRRSTDASWSNAPDPERPDWAS